MSHSPTDSPGHEDLGVPDIRIPVYRGFGFEARRLHRFRQSSLKTIDICMERARLEMSGLMPDDETDAANMGTAMHAAFDLAILEMLEGASPPPLDILVQVAQDEFTKLMTDPAFRWVKKKEGGARHFIEAGVGTWYRAVLPTLQPIATEVRFGPLVLHEDEKRVIEVVGTIDYVDAAGLKDWKTSTGKPWERWEKERWDLQSTMYTWAASQIGHHWEGYDLASYLQVDEHPFEFVVLREARLGNVQVEKYPVTRHSGDFEWMRERALVVAKMIEARLDAWPKNDNHALCSPKWCPAWDQCKGKHYAEGWPKSSAPRG